MSAARLRLPNSHADAIAALHPGPPADFVFPAAPPPTPAERVARAEASLLDTVIERFAGRGGHIGDLARRVIVERATLQSISKGA